MMRAKTTPKNMPITRATGVGIRRALGQAEDIERVGEARVGRSRHAFSPTVCNCSPSYAAARKEPVTNRLTRAELAPHGLRPRKTLAL